MMKLLPNWRWVLGTVFVGTPTAIATYDGFSSQFDLPKLPSLLQQIVSIVPWWGWTALLQFLLLAAMLNWLRKLDSRVDMLKDGPPAAPAVDPEAEAASELQKRRQHLIFETRAFVSEFTKYPRGRDFRDTFEATTIYMQLQRHLSADFLNSFNNRRLIAGSNGGPVDPFAKRLLAELNRLESEWGLA